MRGKAREDQQNHMLHRNLKVINRYTKCILLNEYQLTRSNYFGILQSWNSLDQLHLELFGQRARQSIWIYYIIVEAFRFQPDLVGFLSESKYFRFDGWTISWPSYFFGDVTILMKIIAYDLINSIGGVSQMTGKLQ